MSPKFRPVIGRYGSPEYPCVTSLAPVTTPPTLLHTFLSMEAYGSDAISTAPWSGYFVCQSYSIASSVRGGAICLGPVAPSKVLRRLP